MSATGNGSDEAGQNPLPYRLPLLLAAMAGAVWGLVGMWYGLFAGFRLIGEANRFEQEVGGRQVLWAGAALAAAVVAAALSVRGAKKPGFLGGAAIFVVGSIALSLAGWNARDAAIYPTIAPELRAFPAPSGAHLVQEDPGSWDSPGSRSGSRIWQTDRPLAGVCRDAEAAFRQWATNVHRRDDEACFFEGERGAFGTFIDVDVVTGWHVLDGEVPLESADGRVAIRLAVIAS